MPCFPALKRQEVSPPPYPTLLLPYIIPEYIRKITISLLYSYALSSCDLLPPNWVLLTIPSQQEQCDMEMMHSEPSQKLVRCIRMKGVGGFK